MMKRIVMLGLAGLMSLNFSGCKGSPEKAEKGEFKAQMKLASLTPASHTYNQGAAKFADLIKDRDNQYLMLDSTLVRAHQQATTGRGSGKKKGGATRLWGVPEED